MGSGIARGAKARGKRIAFGDGFRIIWGPYCEEVFRNNPNIAPPGSERDRDIEWIRYFKGHRVYNRAKGGKWIWSKSWTAKPGELFFDDNEVRDAARAGRNFILIEPNVPEQKRHAVNKDWGLKRYQAVADRLRNEGFEVCQFVHPNVKRRLANVRPIETRSFRDAAAILAGAALYVGPEGGLHHAAAAVDIPAVVIFGGFIPPSVTGYSTHTNLTGGMQACGNLHNCYHCKVAMDSISVESVLAAARKYLDPR